MTRIGIIDYGMGNLRSVQKAFAFLGYPAEIINDPEGLNAFDRLVLPGVGAFPEAMSRLRESGMEQALTMQIGAGKPLLGICLGMQMLFESSDEGGYTEGMGIFQGKIQRLPEGMNLKIPHMGWNTLETSPSILFSRDEKPEVYFVHSYCAPVIPQTTAVCIYGIPFSAAVQKDNVVATQFHPEKSGDKGLEMLRRFAAWEDQKLC